MVPELKKPRKIDVKKKRVSTGPYAIYRYYIISFSPVLERHTIAYFISEETEAWKDEVSCPRPMHVISIRTIIQNCASLHIQNPYTCIKIHVLLRNITTMEVITKYLSFIVGHIHDAMDIGRCRKQRLFL